MIHDGGTSSETGSVIVTSTNSESTLTVSLLAFYSNSTCCEFPVETLPMPVPDIPLRDLYRAPVWPAPQLKRAPRVIRQPCWRAGRWKSMT